MGSISRDFVQILVVGGACSCSCSLLVLVWVLKGEFQAVCSREPASIGLRQSIPFQSECPINLFFASALLGKTLCLTHRRIFFYHITIFGSHCFLNSHY